MSTIERLFGVRYMPLLGAVARGEADTAVRGVVDAWRQSFEHSYREAFAALRVTGKRPPMVFDAPEIAARVARLNGARATKLVLVDAMRFDVGERVAERLKDKLAGRAVCVERLLLWSALPTTTPTQLALLARGPDGLRDAEPSSEPEPEIVRGRAVGTLRRDRVGTREVMKLDLVEARLRNAGPGYEDRLESLADEVAPILVKYVETLPPRTLVFLFGDHGFRLLRRSTAAPPGPRRRAVSPPRRCWCRRRPGWWAACTDHRRLRRGARRSRSRRRPAGPRGRSAVRAVACADVAATVVVFAFSAALNNSSVYDLAWSKPRPSPSRRTWRGTGARRPWKCRRRLRAGRLLGRAPHLQLGAASRASPTKTGATSPSARRRGAPTGRRASAGSTSFPPCRSTSAASRSSPRSPARALGPLDAMAFAVTLGAVTSGSARSSVGAGATADPLTRGLLGQRSAPPQLLRRDGLLVGHLPSGSPPIRARSGVGPARWDHT